MSPSLNNGDFVITSCKWFSVFLPKLKVGSLVVVKHPHYQTIVKRVVEIQLCRFKLAGENKESVETEKMGWLSQNELLGVVIFSIKK